MSNLAQMFATAPRMKIYLNNQPVAYAVGFSVSVSVEVPDVYVIGSYAPISQEPVMYNTVSGTLQIVRVLSQNTQNALNTIANGQPQLTSQSAIRPTTDFNALATGGQVVAPSGTTNSIAQSTLALHLDPDKVLLSSSFDVMVMMKVPDLNADGTPNISANSPFGLKEVPFMKIVNCRIASENSNISLGQMTNVPVSFTGLLLTPNNDNVASFSLDGAVKQSVVTGQ